MKENWKSTLLQAIFYSAIVIATPLSSLRSGHVNHVSNVTHQLQARLFDCPGINTIRMGCRGLRGFFALCSGAEQSVVVSYREFDRANSLCVYNLVNGWDGRQALALTSPDTEQYVPAKWAQKQQLLEKVGQSLYSNFEMGRPWIFVPLVQGKSITDTPVWASIYEGYDSRNDEAVQVCKQTINNIHNSVIERAFQYHSEKGVFFPKLDYYKIKFSNDFKITLKEDGKMDAAAIRASIVFIAWELNTEVASPNTAETSL
ncbi:hypothetical protein FRB99_008241, partial [Tulasnella sp. 403]